MNRITRWLTAGAGIAGATYATYVARTWLPYGHPKRSRGDTKLDAFMPDCDVCEQHEIVLDAPPDVTLAAAKSMELDDSRIIRAIFRARELILRRSLLEQMTEHVV